MQASAEPSPEASKWLRLSTRGSWARHLLGASGIFITDRVTPASHQRNLFSDRTVPSCVAAVLRQPPSPSSAAASVWVWSIEPSQVSPGPGTLDLTGVEGWRVVGVCHLQEHHGAGCSLPPGLLQLAALTGDPELLVVHSNDQAACGMHFVIQSLQPAERVSLASTCCSWRALALHSTYYLPCL